MLWRRVKAGHGTGRMESVLVVGGKWCSFEKNDRGRCVNDLLLYNKLSQDIVI